MNSDLQIMLLASVVAAACALPGVFLVLRRTAMLSDAISHTALLGIVLAFLVVINFVPGFERPLDSPLLVIGAALIGLLTVTLVELLSNTGRLNQDAAIGLTFPALFSLAVIMISSLPALENVHLDTDVVLEGNLGFGVGTRSLWIMLAILVINFLFLLIFYKQLKLTTFDPGLAASLGISPVLVHYGLMSLVSVTAVGAFNVVGAILVVALIIAPAVTAYLLTDRLIWMIILSVLIGVVCSIAGYWLSIPLDTSTSGTIVAVLGAAFGLVFLFAPQQGIVSQSARRRNQKWEFAQTALVIHLQNHEHEPVYTDEANVEHCQEHMQWTHDFTERVVHLAQRENLLKRRGDVLFLTDSGRIRANEAIESV